ncbi:hypothetical protein [Parachitinimonas caeni]|uniref:Uncharacterized protein n=1 Tax=Parachitinimonas caeni TaxID=3031301 RepID=A0ABT7DWM2_9NEIS|nr:hypothetical protein [Parachitinimonas caeni]MDK2124474.1 hypothetical protein [Parachitinimonas caeni]
MLNPAYGWLVGIAAGAAVLAGGGGAWVGYRYGQQQGEATVQRLRADQATARAEATSRAASRYQSAVEFGEQLARLHLSQLASLQTASRQRLQRVSHVSTVYRPTPAVAAVPVVCTIPNGWLRDYNAAFGLSDPVTNTGQLTSQTAAAASPEAGLLDDLATSGVSLADLRAHSEDLASWCQATAAQRDRLLDLLTSQTSEDSHD